MPNGPGLIRPPKYRRPIVADMAVALSAGVPDLGDDEACRRCLEANGYRPLAATVFLDRARDLARNARAVESDFWGSREWP